MALYARFAFVGRDSKNSSENSTMAPYARFTFVGRVPRVNQKTPVAPHARYAFPSLQNIPEIGLPSQFFL